MEYLFSKMKKYKGRIVEVKAERGGFQYLIQGVKKGQQPFYNKHCIGGHGTYLGADETYPVLNVKVSVYDFDNHAVNVDIREIVLEYYDWQRITERRIDDLRSKLVGKKVSIIETNEDYKIDNIESFL
jgi:hypothetical protein